MPQMPPSDYLEWQSRIIRIIHDAPQYAAPSSNQEKVPLYWKIGSEINEHLDAHGWGPDVIDWLSSGLVNAFPDSDEWSREKLTCMSDFAKEWPEFSVVIELAGMPWQHHLVLLQELNRQTNREWYARKSMEYGWSVVELSERIAAKLHLCGS